MWRRIVCALALTALFCSGLQAQAAKNCSDVMRVEFCQEWVSLRAEPNKASERLAKLPEYTEVRNCQVEEDGYVYCEYQGQRGYILAEFLAMPYDLPTELECRLPDGRVLKLTLKHEHSFVENRESLLVTCRDKNGNVLWKRSEVTSYAAELLFTNAFVGGRAERPIVYMYNADRVGLTALDPESGRELWNLPKEEVDLGASTLAVTDEKGVIYICSKNSEPVAIDENGKVLWEGVSDYIWPYSMSLTKDGLVVHYEIGVDDEHFGVHCYDPETGRTRWVKSI